MRNKMFQLKNKKTKIMNFLKIEDKIFQLNNKKTKITKLKKKTKIIFQPKINIYREEKK